MKLQKNNNYAKKITAGLSAAILSASILVGCGSVEKVESTPIEVIESTPVLTPAPTPMEELSYDEEIALLGILDPEKPHSISALNVIEYTINGCNRVMFAAINSQPNEKGGHDVKEWFTEELVFSIDYDIFTEEYTTNCEDTSRISVINENLEDAKIIKFFFIGYWMEESILVPENLKNSDYAYNLSGIVDSDGKTWVINTEANNLEIADIYLNIVPKEYRLSADELVLDDSKVLTK